MKKTVMFAFMLLACLLVMPNVYAADVTYPTIEDATKSDTLQKGSVEVSEVKVDKDGKAQVNVTVNNATFKLLDNQSGENRPDNYAWIGLKFTMPSGATDIKIANQSETASGSDHTFDEYFGFNVQELTEAAEAKKDYVVDYELSWKETGKEPEEKKLTIHIVVKPESTTLIKKDAETEEWNETKYLETSKQVKLTVYVTTTNGESGEEYPVEFYLPEGTKLTQKSLLAKLGVSSKYVLEGIYGEDDETAFDFSKALSESTTIHVYFLEKTSAKQDTNTEEENPSTSDNLLVYASLGVVALVAAMGTGLYLRRN